MRLVRPVEKGGYGLDALWNDDFHHTAVVALTGHNEAYYTDYLGTPQEFISAVKYGYLYQGQRYTWQKKRRGTPALDLPPAALRDLPRKPRSGRQLGRGQRLHAPDQSRPLSRLTALLLLARARRCCSRARNSPPPARSSIFADHIRGAGPAGAQGAGRVPQAVPQPGGSSSRRALADPADPTTFERCKLDFTERQSHAEAYALHRDLLRLRREDPVFRASSRAAWTAPCSAPEAFVLRFFGDDGDDRLLLVNLGRDLHLDPAPEPLLAPPEDKLWDVLWSSEDPRYGGDGTPPPDTEDNWRIPGHAAIALVPRPAPPECGDLRGTAAADWQAAQVMVGRRSAGAQMVRGLNPARV